MDEPDDRTEPVARASARINLVPVFPRHRPGVLSADEVAEQVFFEGDERRAFIGRFASLLVLSTTIAALGLLSDSEAVVIGAMLVAPLMAPILAAAVAIIRADPARLGESAALLAAGLAAAVTVGFLVSAVAAGGVQGESDLPAQVVARTAPGLLDLGIAVAAGAAGGYVLSRRAASAALPGVGISVALVPPLAAVGICLEVGATDLARGALLLFLTNLAAIVFSASVVLVASGAMPPLRSRSELVGVRAGVLAVLLAVAAVAVPLTLHTRSVLEDDALRDQVADAVTEWDPSVVVEELVTDRRGDRASVSLVVRGPNDPVPTWRLADSLSERWGGPMDLDVLHFRVTEGVTFVR